MAILGDYHTHTKYSRHNHGKSSIEDNVRVAYEKGLRQVGISDHGFNQKLYGVRRKDIEKVKLEIEDAKERYPIEVLLGIEANLISSNGDIDIVEQDYSVTPLNNLYHQCENDVDGLEYTFTETHKANRYFYLSSGSWRKGCCFY